ncbi:hypothetical protein [Rhodothermus marinus]|uniref:hypothetical protein n=1 Tax=Rhodothermus marinus TaxID=29549 RepID=UPI0012BA5152|nr:hypothetical protein [Rhodothermus marinus]BBM68942.1 hypothetical protein RmaAA213_07880 [Rhodothermus marinus]BBM71920.1 hypothetical protein RmaAA338_07850 [Rhodothermus marinus]
MQSLFTYISGLLSVFVLFLQLWRFASLDRALLTAALTGLGAFLVLQVGYVAIRWILTLAPPRTEADESAEENSSDRAETDTSEHASRMTAPAAA